MQLLGNSSLACRVNNSQLYRYSLQFSWKMSSCSFSRRVLWLHVGPSNNDPKIVAYYYLKCVQQLRGKGSQLLSTFIMKGMPRLLRSDCGTENSNVAFIFEEMVRIAFLELRVFDMGSLLLTRQLYSQLYTSLYVHNTYSVLNHGGVS